MSQDTTNTPGDTNESLHEAEHSLTGRLKDFKNDDERLDARKQLEQLQATFENSHHEGADDDELDPDNRRHKHLARCLIDLLIALNWSGTTRHMVEQMVDIEEIDTLDGVFDALTKLNMSTLQEKMRLRDIDDDMLPCLAMASGKRLYTLLEKTEDGIIAQDGQTGKRITLQPSREKLTVHLPIELEHTELDEDLARLGWIRVLTGKFNRLIIQAFAVTLLTNLTAMAVPIYVMMVYDKAIGTKSTGTLKYFLFGIAIVIIFELGLRLVRGRMLAYLGARIDALTSTKAFQHLIYMPLQLIESAPISAQITRLRQFENVREFFAGSLAQAILDIPFVLLFLTAVFIIGGPLILVPIALMCVYAVLGFTIMPIYKARLAKTGSVRQKMQAFTIEAVRHHRTINENRATETWMSRFRQLSHQSVTRHFEAEQLNLFMITIAQTLITIGGTTTLYFGTYRVIEGHMSVGALIGSMALIWRLLSPVQAIFLAMSRLSQTLNAFKQINTLFKMPLERMPNRIPNYTMNYNGAITLSRVSFRFQGETEPALAGVSIAIPCGQVVAITGPTSGGKSTLLKTISGLYKAQAGAVLIDGVDLRHADPSELRSTIGYVPDHFDYLPGTVESNLLLANPLATDEDMRAAWSDARLDDCIHDLPEGLKTVLPHDADTILDEGVKQRLMLASAYVKKPKIYLLDKPEVNLDDSGTKALQQKIMELKEHSTVIIVTHRPDLMRLANRILYMQSGQVVADGKPEEIIPVILQAA